MSHPDLSTTEWCDGWSHRGPRHAATGQPSQDAFLTLRLGIGGSPVTVLAVADGHGAAEHPCSAEGAVMATLCVQDLICSFVAHGGGNRSPRGRETEFESLVSMIHSHWREQVWRYEQDEPLLAGEPAGADQTSTDQTQKEAVLIRYGTTLRLAVIELDDIWLAAIGDGATACSVDEQLAFYHTEFDKVGSETRSLCGSKHDWQITRIRRRPGTQMSVVLMTDGVSDPLARDELRDRIKEVLTLARAEGARGVRRDLPGRLTAWSERESGDDATLALWVDLGAKR